MAMQQVQGITQVGGICIQPLHRASCHCGRVQLELRLPDGLIDPRDTRKLLGFLLDICAEAAVRPLKSNTFGVARL